MDQPIRRAENRENVCKAEINMNYNFTFNQKKLITVSTSAIVIDGATFRRNMLDVLCSNICLRNERCSSADSGLSSVEFSRTAATAEMNRTF
jgi:hypothetical protein